MLFLRRHRRRLPPLFPFDVKFTLRNLDVVTFRRLRPLQLMFPENCSHHIFKLRSTCNQCIVIDLLTTTSVVETRFPIIVTWMHINNAMKVTFIFILSWSHRIDTKLSSLFFFTWHFCFRCNIHYRIRQHMCAFAYEYLSDIFPFRSDDLIAVLFTAEKLVQTDNGNTKFRNVQRFASDKCVPNVLHVWRDLCTLRTGKQYVSTAESILHRTSELVVHAFQEMLPASSSPWSEIKSFGFWFFRNISSQAIWLSSTVPMHCKASSPSQDFSLRYSSWTCAKRINSNCHSSGRPLSTDTWGKIYAFCFFFK